MTDQEINRAVAEARGWHTNDGVAWIMPCGTPQFLHDVCTDPAAWGALFEELTRAGHMPSLEGYDNFGYTAEVCPLGKDHGTPMNDPAPGRALALAFLKAVQP